MSTNEANKDMAPHTTASDKDERPYTAPYEAWPGTSEAPNHYALYIKEGYEIQQAGWLSGDTPQIEPVIEQTGFTSRDHSCVLTPEQREKIRGYAGLEKTVQFGDDAWLRARTPNIFADEERHIRMHGYLVYFADKSYTVEQHFARIGRKVDYHLSAFTGYFAEDNLAFHELEDIFSDPNVLYIDESTTGSFTYVFEDENDIAPFEPALGDCEAPDHYVVYFKQGYDIEQRGWFSRLTSRKSIEPVIVREPKYNAHRQETEINCVLTPYQREQTRRLPGIAKVVQYGNDTWLRSRKVISNVNEERGVLKARGYTVGFANEEYTVEQHFARLARLGRSFKHEELPPCHYRLEQDLSADELADVFSDPNVFVIEEQTTGGGRVH